MKGGINQQQTLVIGKPFLECLALIANSILIMHEFAVQYRTVLSSVNFTKMNSYSSFGPLVKIKIESKINTVHIKWNL